MRIAEHRAVTSARTAQTFSGTPGTVVCRGVSAAAFPRDAKALSEPWPWFREIVEAGALAQLRLTLRSLPSPVGDSGRDFERANIRRSL
jgi:hypothetical protein